MFDVAKRLMVAEVADGGQVQREEVSLDGTHFALRARWLVDHGVNVLICGAISGPLEQMVRSVGVNVIPQTCGAVEEILQAFLSGRLTEQAFLLPGCCGQRRRFRGGRRRGQFGTNRQGDT